MAKAGGNLLNTYVADYVVFDLETTGISPKTDEVVEISAVKVEHGKVTDEFSTLVNPKRRIPYGASRVNGITDDMVAEAPFFEQVLEEFLEFIEGFVLVGHNIARFDMSACMLVLTGTIHPPATPPIRALIYIKIIDVTSSSRSRLSAVDIMTAVR